MLEVKDLSVLIETRYLIESLSFNLNYGDKLAIIGEEGNGKSTLLKAILGICDYASVKGLINTHNNRIGYLEQTMNNDNLNKKVYDYLFNNDDDYYRNSNNMYKYLKKLNINELLLEQVINTLSGGERVKVGILKLLLADDDILFLDEPTNDLDIETLEWLEKFINDCNKPIIYISHDETLLANTANMILHIEQLKKKRECHHTIIRTTYNDYIKNRIKTIDKQTQISRSEKKEYLKKQEKLQQILQKVEYQQNTISRKDPFGAKLLKKKMHSLKSQEKRLNDTKLTPSPDLEDKINVFFTDVFIPKRKIILDLNIKELKVSNRVLASDIKFSVIGNKHICIIGKNGVGKSTLIKEIYQKLKTREDINVGYMPQNYDDVFKDYVNVLDFVARGKTNDEITKIRLYLGNMQFTNEEMIGKISDLSNGTKAKLFFMKLVIDECNVLILDEPTRNVSPLSNPIFRNALKNFKGTIISVSHDRKYINEVIDDLYLFNETGLTKILNLY